MEGQIKNRLGMSKNGKHEPIRVVHYIGALELGGSQSFVMELYRNIDRSKIQFDFIVFEGWRGDLYDEIEKLGGEVYDSPKYNGLNHLKYTNWWNKFLKDHPEYQVVHGHVRSVASIYLPIIKKYGRFSILHSHSASNGHGLSAVIKFFLQLPVRHQADFYMACSDAAGRWLFGEKVFKSTKYQTVPNAINTDRFAFDSDVRDKIRKEYGLESILVIGHVGRFYEVKNQSFLLDVLEECLQTRKDVKLMLVGDGPMRDEIELKTKSKGLDSYVLFIGARTDTEKYYNAIDVFAFPSLWEGLGIAVIEAQICGLHCVVSEGIPVTVDINAGLVSRLPLESGQKVWSENILRTDLKDRSSHVMEAKESGYDIKNNAVKMQGFYLKEAKRTDNRSGERL